ncbi:MAG TPA: hypothetical protein O0X27_05310 [Methanocorpusculum sp.]|nr:hypothetical protein [Methanocorpusculum sp.]
MEGETYTEKQTRIVSYLQRAIAKGQIYFKSKHIAREIGLSAQEIGSNMILLSTISDDLEISRWGYSGTSTTWKVTSKSKLDSILDGTPEPTPADF